MPEQEHELVSIIMPAFNAEAFLGEAVESVLAQTHDSWELWIVNDGSTDRTPAMADGFAARDHRINVIHQGNSRQGAARNAALARTRGNWVAFLDADDTWLPKKLAAQLQAIARTNPDFVFSEAETWSDGTYEGLMGSHTGWIAGKKGIDELLDYNRIPILTTMVKKQVLQDAGGFCTRQQVQNAEDYELWLRLLAKGYRGYGMSEVLARYRRHPHAATAAASPHKLYWPACAALVAVADKVPAYRQQLMDDLVPKLLYWFEFYTDAQAPELTQLFASYFGIKGRRVPGELALLMHLPEGSRIARKYFRSRYVHG